MNEIKETSKELSPTKELIETRLPSSPRRFILLIVIPAILIITTAILYLMGGRYVETENAYIKADKVPISSQVSGVIKEILVQENQSVSKNQILFRLDPQPFQVALTKAESQLAQARINILAMKSSYREKQAEITLARTKYEFSLRNKKRQSDLAAKHFVSISNLDDAQEGAEVAAQQLVTAEHDLQRLADSLAGGIDEPVEQHPSYLIAKAELDQAKLNLAHTEIRASMDGFINSPPKLGQYIPAGTITMTLVANGHPWVEANFTEKELANIRPGQKVIATVDIYPGKKWKGIVESLSPATGSEFSIIPAQNATGNWVKIAQRVAVRIKLIPEPNNPQLLSGLSSWVKIDTGAQHDATQKTS
jgi:membrane fusion protein (multidrug efflux system)